MAFHRPVLMHALTKQTAHSNKLKLPCVQDLFLTYLLLSLAHRLYINDSNLGAQLTEVLMPKGLCQNVCQLFSCSDELQPDPVMLHTFMNEMVTSFYILTAVMKHRVLLS
jgi:hypothetical protein